MSLWNVQMYDQGELISIDVIEGTEVQPMTEHFERGSYDLRSISLMLNLLGLLWMYVCIRALHAPLEARSRAHGKNP
jgi:hypothetical protein